MTRESFPSFSKAQVTTLTTMILIFDGASTHRRSEEPRETIYLRILPPYSPFRNIVEQVISCMKASVKAENSRCARQSALKKPHAMRNCFWNTGSNCLLKRPKEALDPYAFSGLATPSSKWGKHNKSTNVLIAIPNAKISKWRKHN